MYTNLAKSPAFPMAMRVSSQPRSCFKLFHTTNLESSPLGPVKAMGISLYSHCRVLGTSNVEKPKGVVSSGFWLKSGTRHLVLGKGRGFSTSSAQKVNEKRLPWLALKEGNRVRAEREKVSKTSRSSWEESAERLDKVSVKSSWEESAKRLDRETTGKHSRDGFSKRSGGSVVRRRESRNRIVDVVEDRQRDYVSEDKGLDRETASRPSRGGFAKRSDGSIVRSRDSRNGIVDVVEDRRRDYVYKEKRFEENGEDEEEEEEEEEDAEVVGDPRWDKIKSRFKGVVDRRDGYERPEFRRWDKQENWGRQTWKEATESSVPKMVGEGVYGVGPVLAALSAGRREFYTLHVQEGLDLSSNNRKKKDKKGFEKIMKMAEKLGIRINQVSKHDLNMVVDNRPHQGLVLDASPLEMVKIKELDPVSVEEDKNSLWVALDEVTDPQNLGAIIRSSYFFGASGVVLCAKNSAPLSGVVSKASAGSLELMELRFCKNMMQFLISSAENGWRVIGGSVSSKAVPLNEIVPGTPTILVLGSEGTGLRPLVERSCTQLVRIPSNVPVDMVPNGEEDIETDNKSSGSSAADFQSFLAVESLNVSVAAGVLLHHLIGDEYYKKDTAKIDPPTGTHEE